MECYITYCVKGFFAFNSENELICKKLFPEDEIINRLAEINDKQIVKEESDRPQPRMDRNASNGMAVTVGRLRKDAAFDNSFKYVLVGHNTIRGAAGASILNAELINDKIL